MTTWLSVTLRQSGTPQWWGGSPTASLETLLPLCSSYLLSSLRKLVPDKFNIHGDQGTGHKASTDTQYTGLHTNHNNTTI